MNKTLKKLNYGHYILTTLKKGEELQTRDKDYIAAGTINWASQVSFEPPMIAVAVGQQSDLNETIDYSGHFTLHLLGEGNKEMVEKFGSKSTIENGKINGVNFKKKDGEVILENTLGYLTCKLKKSMNIGDHTIHFGEVIKDELFRDEKALSTAELPTKYSPEVAEV